jgi:hypothetical protein
MTHFTEVKYTQEDNVRECVDRRGVTMTLGRLCVIRVITLLRTLLENSTADLEPFFSLVSYGGFD